MRLNIGIGTMASRLRKYDTSGYNYLSGVSLQRRGYAQEQMLQNKPVSTNAESSASMPCT